MTRLLRKRPVEPLPAEKWRKSPAPTKRAYGIVRRKPLKGKVPKRGLEPPLPKREPGPEPGVSARALHFCDVASTLQSVPLQRFMAMPGVIRTLITLG